MEDIDFKVKVTRAELEVLSQDLFTRVRGPIDAALTSANMKLEDIQSLVLVGGGVRVPAVQSNLAAIVGEDKIAKNVNGDEAAVMGAVFRAASLSRQFKVKEVRLKDISPFPIEVKYSGETKEGEPPGKAFVTPIFSEKSTLGTRKIMTFKRVTDFGFDLEYGDVPHTQEREIGSREIAHVSLSGLTDAIHKFKDVSVASPKVKVTLELSDSGILNVQEAIATIETDNAKKASFADKFKSLFGGSEKNGDVKDVPKENEEEQQGEEPKESEKEAADKEKNNKTEQGNGNATEASAKNETIPTTQIEKVVLTVQLEHRGITPLDADSKKESRLRIQRLDAHDSAKRAREEARNSLESFLYRGRDLLEKQEIIEVSTEEERQKFEESLSLYSGWLDENEDALMGEFQTRLQNLHKHERPLSIRAAERISRPKAFEALSSSVNAARSLGENLLTGEDAYHLPEEVQKLHDECDKVLAWTKEKQAAQDALPLWQDPIVTTQEIQIRGRAVERELHRLLSKKKPKVTKKKEENTSTTKAEGEGEGEKKEPASNTTTEEAKEPLATPEPVVETEAEKAEKAPETEAPVEEPVKHTKDEL